MQLRALKRVTAHCCVVVAALTCIAGALNAQVQAGTIVRPETTTVGQHFVATIRVRVLAGSQISFPARPDSSSHVDSAGPVARGDSTAGGFTVSTASYVLAAWDTGAQSVGLAGVTVVTGAGSQTIPLNGLKVYVRSVLPRDTALRKPKPFRPALPVASFDWRPYALAAAAALLLALLLYAWSMWRRRRARGLTPFHIAQREFARVESERLVEKGEGDRHAIEMLRVMRVYLANVVPAAMLSATTHELATMLRFERIVPVHRVIALLDQTDRIKFARERSTAERANQIGIEARAIVTDVNTALEAEAVTAKKAA